jgi:hypothetical protein
MNKALRSAATSLWLILAVALAVRLVYAWDFQSHRPKQALSVIPFLFESGNVAYSLATGHGFSSPFHVETGPTAWMTPVYPIILAGIFKMCGLYTFGAWIAAVLLNILWSAFTCAPIFLVGRRIAGLGVAAGAAWLWAIFPNAFQISVQSLWDASLSALLAATILWATLAVTESQRMRDWCGYALLWGLALMTNATLSSLLPLLLAWMAYRARRRGLGWLAKPVLAFGIAILCCVPWTIRNEVVFHSFVPLRSVLGLQLWMGNNAQAKDVWLGEGHPIQVTAERAKYIQMGEIAYMREKKQQAIQYMLTHPRREAHLMGHRFITLWAGGATNPARDFFSTKSMWFRTVLLFNLAAAAGALLGIVVLCWKRSPYAFPLTVFPVVYPCAYYLTLALPRYRLPIDPIVLLLTAIAAQGVFHRITHVKMRNPAGAPAPHGEVAQT